MHDTVAVKLCSFITPEASILATFHLGLLPTECGGAFGIGDIYDSPRTDHIDSPFSPPQPKALFVDQESGKRRLKCGKCQEEKSGKRSLGVRRETELYVDGNQDKGAGGHGVSRRSIPRERGLSLALH